MNSHASGAPPAARAPHPVVWAILYLPFGALSGFVTVALTFLATERGLSISEGALLYAAQMLTQWAKWLWAPVVDVTLTPRRWYVLSTAASALAVVWMSVVPLGPDTLGLLLAIIATSGLINSMVGMAVEAMIAEVTPTDQVGRVSGWLQAGNLGSVGLGGGLGLFLIRHLPKPWMAGAIIGVIFMACCALLKLTPEVKGRHRGQGAVVAVKGVVGDLREMLKTKGGLLSAILCVMPVGTGNAQNVLTQAKVAAFWGAGATEVELMQGLVSGIVTAVGCFVGGAICQRVHPRTAYAAAGIGLAAITTAMAASPASVTMYVIWSVIYAFGVGVAYAGFSAIVFISIGNGSGATKYNVYASLSNFPIWWLGMVLGVAAQRWGARHMLLTEAAFNVLGVIIFAASVLRVRRSALPDG